MAAAGERQGDVLKNLWDKLPDPADAQAALNQIIETEWDDELWRRVVIDTPAIFQYCRERLIRFDAAGIYPLKRSQMNGAHVELYTYGAYVALQEAGGLKALKMEYRETSSAEEPSLGLDCMITGKRYEFLLMSHESNDSFDLWLDQPKSPAAPLAALLAKQGFAIDRGYLTRTLGFDNLQSAIRDLDAALVRVDAQKAV